jgi:hypothetical protein
MSESNALSLVETKLTKGEAIDLLVQEFKNDLEAKIKENERQIKELESSFTTADLVAGTVRFFTMSERYSHSKLMLSFRIERNQLSTSGKLKVDALERLSEEREVMRKQEYAFESKGNKAKNMILKAMLEGSEEGKQFLALLDGLKLKVAPKLLPTG